ncbi:cation channel sperm-associated protein 1-like [Osmerus eperlanus]|uniref:cation channel sperm-associated protein 1-like n=1 Tax=Osmerus eperlanus TaxID=29151 RepID=UPI002E0EF4D5
MEDPTTSQECTPSVPSETGQDDKPSSGARGRSTKRVFTDLEMPDGDVLKKLIEIDRDRKLRTMRQSSSYWRYLLGTLLTWLRKLFRIISTFTLHPFFDQFIMFVVVINTGTLVALTFESVNVRGGWFFSALDAAFLAIYLMEWLLKTLVLGRVYYKSVPNDLDVFIVVLSLIDFMLPLIEATGSVGGGGQVSTAFRVLKMFKGARAIRVFRVLRTLRFLHNLQSIVNTCLQSFQSMGAIILLMFTFLFMFAVIFREMFYKSDPERFGTMFRTIFTLFQLLTLDDWAFIYSTSKDNGAPHIIIFLVLYIVVEYFTFLNLFIAVLVDNFQQTIKKRMAAKIQMFQDTFESEMQEIRKIAVHTSEPQSDLQFYQETLNCTYSDNKYGQREKEFMIMYLSLLAAIDQQQHTFRSQTSTLERIIDTFFEATEEDLHGNESSF